MQKCTWFLFHVPGRPVISHSAMPTEKVSEFFDHHLEPVMQEGQSYVKDTQEFLNKIKKYKSAILVTVEVVGLYLIIPHQTGVEAFTKALDKRKKHKVPLVKLVKMIELVSKNIDSQYLVKVYLRAFGTAIGSKFTPPCIFLDQMESKFL